VDHKAPSPSCLISLNGLETTRRLIKSLSSSSRFIHFFTRPTPSRNYKITSVKGVRSTPLQSLHQGQRQFTFAPALQSALHQVPPTIYPLSWLVSRFIPAGETISSV
jgi:hypothetical protein